MIAEGIDDLEIEKVFKDIAQLEDFTFLRRLSIRGLMRGIGTLQKLTELSHLSLWQLTNLDAEWLENMSSLERLFCHTVKFKAFHLPRWPCQLKLLELNLCKGFDGHLDISELKRLQTLSLEACGNIRSISDCSRLVDLRRVVISNIRDIASLDGIAAAPNLESIIVQNTPQLAAKDIKWMLVHPSLKSVYPALKAEDGAPILDEIRRILSPRFGDDLFA
jgi:hypothetical protein